MLPPIRKKNVNDENPDLQAPTGGGAGFKPHLQPIGSELGKDAQVWEVYVDETDRSDKELVKGWNDSLDVLLIFATLFSAITTALVLESSKQLKPDPAETSAQTLLVISQILATTLNGQAVKNSTLPDFQPSGFSPSRLSILVNALWFLSLTLSVAVSLMAMLSKSWCNVFMSGRSGPKYEQGRRRHCKWNGIERWGMVGVFVYLPILMHLALLLFAIGLSLYLWTINLAVAVPAFLVTVIFVSVYAIVTVLPLGHVDCPYSTPLSMPLARVLPATRRVCLVYWGYLLCYLQTILTATLGFLVKHLHSQYLTRWHDRLPQRWHRVDTSQEGVVVPRYRAVFDNGATPMDDVTCHMLLWLISNCEDSRLVDVALQSIAGARHEFPWSMLLDAHVTEILAQRLDDCIIRDRQHSSAIYLKPTVSIESALLYAQALCRLLATNGSSDYRPRMQISGTSSAVDDVGTALGQKLVELFDLFQGYIWDSTPDVADPNLDTIAISYLVILNRSSCQPEQLRGRHYPNREIQIWSDRLVRDHSERTITMDPRALLALLEATPYRMIDGMMSMSDQERSDSTMQLVQLIRSPSCSAPDFQYALGLALTTAALLMHQYPGGEHPVNSVIDPTARAIEVLRYYKVQHHEDPKTLVAFGLLGLLDRSETHNFSDNEITVFANTLTRLGDIYSIHQRIHTLPEALGLTQYAKQILEECLQAAPERGSLGGGEVALVSCITDLIRWSYMEDDPDFIPVTLKAFCASHNRKFQRVCSKLLGRPNVGAMWRFDLERFNPALFNRLIDISMGDDVYIAPTAMYHLWVLVERLMKEVNGSSKRWLADVLDQILKHDAFVSLRARASDLPSSPRNICEVGFTDMWYPLLREMCNHKTAALAVQRSKSLYVMCRSYRPETAGIAPYLEELRDGRSWYQMLGELYNMPIPDEAPF